MSLLAEDIVEEWLNRQGYFTIRGIKLGVHEMDLLAVRCDGSGSRRHIEVQSSVNPVSYFTQLPKSVQKETGRPAQSAKTRTPEELRDSAADWVKKKFLHPAKETLRQGLAPGMWDFELVTNRVKFPEELEMVASHGIKLISLAKVVHDLCQTAHPYTASGRDLMDLIGAMQGIDEGELVASASM
jgi:hypothetical protein